MVQLSSLIAVLALGFLSTAHPGQSDMEKRAEAHARRTYLASLENTDLAHCGGALTAKGVVERTIARRRDTVINLRKRAGIELDEKLEKRQAQQFAFKDVLAKNHRSNLNLGSSWANADWSSLGQNQTVVLHPEVTEGPYYVSGEYIRKDVRDKEPGLTVHLDLQVIDIKTCQPVVNSAVEIWASNATGVYSGVEDTMGGFMGNGNSDKVSQAANLQNQALRGIQITNKDGSVQFDTIVPGHYMGRTNHIHVMTHRNQTVLANNTITGGTVNHVGQIYFDQSLIEEMQKLEPYKYNKNPQTLNKQDILMAAGTQGMVDNVVHYVLVGNKLEDGIFAWINFGVDTGYTRYVNAATICGEKGCATKPFNFMEAISGFLSGKGAPAPMPQFPPGGIPGLELGFGPFTPGAFPALDGILEGIASFFGGKGAKSPKDPKGLNTSKEGKAKMARM